jgi:uncharacterized protein
MTALNLEVLPGTFAVTKLAPGSPTPDWATRGPFTSVTRTTEELSIVGPEENVPPEAKCERGWRCLRVAGPLDFSMVGILASLLDPLAAAGVAVFVISTFDTDYILVKAHEFEKCARALEAVGHQVHQDNDCVNG